VTAPGPRSRSGLPSLRRTIAETVSDVFNDRARGERPITRKPYGLFGPESVAWRVHGDVTTMMIGGVSSLLLQMLHPAVLAGVWDHSSFRADMHGRLKRTARFIALTTYGSAEEAHAIIDRVRGIHAGVRGELPDGTPYRADDPGLLTWVHLTETLSFINAWTRYAEPRMSTERQDRYFAEVAQIGRALGADPVPETRRGTEQLIADMRPQLRSDARTKAIARLVLSQRADKLVLAPALGITLSAGIDLLPPWARTMHGLNLSPVERRATRLGALALAQTLRWAFRAQ
jgi:uncharacterized protein (DUF2236 family)